MVNLGNGRHFRTHELLAIVVHLRHHANAVVPKAL